MVFKDKSKMEKRCRQKAKYLVNKKNDFDFFQSFEEPEEKIDIYKISKIIGRLKKAKTK